MCDLVFKVFHNPEEIRSINQTFIALIPKVEHPEVGKHFRPISLYNVIYKVITKILANRLKRIMPFIIALTQYGFTPGRNSSNNFIVAQRFCIK